MYCPESYRVSNILIDKLVCFSEQTFQLLILYLLAAIRYHRLAIHSIEDSDLDICSRSHTYGGDDARDTKRRTYSEQSPNHRHRNLKAFEERIQTHVSFYLSPSLSFFLSFSLSLSLSLSIYLSISIYHSIYHYLYLFLSLSLYIYIYIYIYIYRSICLSIYPSPSSRMRSPHIFFNSGE